MNDQSAKETQAEQQKLLEEALKQPGVRDAVEAYGHLGQYAAGIPQPLMRSGYAVGGNA
jgi:hypothetical protein